MSQNLDNHVLLRRSQIEEISINKMITNYKNIKPSLACVFVQNGNSCKDFKASLSEDLLQKIGLLSIVLNKRRGISTYIHIPQKLTTVHIGCV
jgi:hypothetical protein